MDYIETTPHVSRLHHFRIVSFMGILLVSILLWQMCRLITLIRKNVRKQCVCSLHSHGLTESDQPAHLP